MAGLLRWLIAMVLAFMVTLALFLFMRFLIEIDAVQIIHASETPNVSIAEYVEDEVPTTRLPPVQPNYEAPPAQPVIRSPQAQLPSEGTLTSYTPPVVTPEVDLTELSGALIAPAPLSVRTPPVYPMREQERGISGRCTVRYDILASGQTANLQVTNCDSAGFARASMNAVSQWRHEAISSRSADTIVNTGVETTLVFELEG